MHAIRRNRTATAAWNDNAWSATRCHHYSTCYIGVGDYPYMHNRYLVTAKMLNSLNG